MLQIRPIPVYDDNYVWVVYPPQHPQCVIVVDPGDAAPVLAALRAEKLQPAAILITHSHWDHITGISAILAEFAIPVYGPPHPQIPEITHPVDEGDYFELLNIHFEVLALPGHMPEHRAYVIRDAAGQKSQPTQILSGDVLFSAGCGRIFSGTHEQLKTSLDRLNAFPTDTLIYPTHEYTLANLAFAQAVEPANLAIETHIQRVRELRRQQQPSLPTRLELERQINPFLRTRTPSVRRIAAQRLAREPIDDQDVFTCLRQWKNQF